MLSGLGGWRQTWARFSDQLFYIRGQEWFSQFSFSQWNQQASSGVQNDSSVTLLPLRGVLGK